MSKERDKQVRDILKVFAFDFLSPQMTKPEAEKKALADLLTLMLKAVGKDLSKEKAFRHHRDDHTFLEVKAYIQGHNQAKAEIRQSIEEVFK